MADEPPVLDRLAQALHATWGTPWDWDEADESEKESARIGVRAVLTAQIEMRLNGDLDQEEKR